MLQFAATFAEAKTLRIGLAEDPDILDPASARLFISGVVLATMCDRLFAVGENATIVPQLATGFSWSDDHQTVTIELRQGVRFHDGEPFDAEAVKYNIKRGLNLPGSVSKSYYGPISRIDTFGDYRIQIGFSSPYAPFIANLTSRSGMMISPKAAKEKGDAFAKHPVCAGPFKFVERIAQDRIVVERFEDYWNRENIFIDRVVFRHLDSAARFANLRSGDIDLLERMAASDYVEISKYPQLKAASVSGFSYFYFYIIFNVANGSRSQTPLGQDARIREAFELSIDRNVINDVVFSGQYIPTNQWFPPDDPYYASNLPIMKRDVEQARRLLAEAGVPHPKLELMLVPSPEIRQVAEMLQSMAGEAGFDISMRLTETATAVQASRKGDFDAFLAGYLGRGDPHTQIAPSLACRGPFNEGRYCNSKLDQILLDASEHFPPEERQPLYHEAASIILRDRPNVYLVSRRFLFGFTAKLSGFRPIPGGFIHLQGVKLD